MTEHPVGTKACLPKGAEPILRVVPGPSDINANGHIFGGWVLSQMDIAAGIVASRRAGGSDFAVRLAQGQRSKR